MIRVTLEKWIPKIDDYCIFYNGDAKGFRISKFKGVSENEKFKDMFMDSKSNFFKYCEPFIGKLPSNNFVLKPEFGKFYIFFNKNDKDFRVSQFKQIGYGGDKKGKYKDFQSNYFDFCCEYEGKFPFYLKLEKNYII